MCGGRVNGNGSMTSVSNLTGAVQSGAIANGGAADGAVPTPNSWLGDLHPYIGGESALEGGVRVVKLSSNENPMGPSPRAIDAFRRCADSLHIYPDGGAARLRAAIASVHGISPDRIVCGAGSDELISLLCQAYCAPGDEVLHTAHAFAMYRISAMALGAKPVAAPEKELTADVDALLARVTPRTKLLFLANPSNPTGSYLNRDAMIRLLSRLPGNVLLVLDEAYAEYMRSEDYESGLKMVDAYPNVVATRTFSKIHGLAALRLGWAYCPAGVAEALNKVRGPFNVSAPALAAGEAAIQDVDYAEACAIQNEVWRDWLLKQLRSAGVACPPAWANFVLPYFGETGAASAPAADAFLRSRGVIARRMDSYGLGGHLRITVGASADNVLVARAIADFMAGAEA